MPLILFLNVLLWTPFFHAQEYSPKVYYITIDDGITLLTAEYIQTAIDTAHLQHAAALLINLDTPGGLYEATRHIAQSILNSKIPVIVYVSPSGARAGSAGVFIALCAHVVAMAPGTNIGAAHPV